MPGSPFRQTSLEAWDSLRRSQDLGTQQRHVAEVLAGATAPRTAREVQRRAGPGDYCHKRLSELERAGVVVRCEARLCGVTGRKADTWAIAAQGRVGVPNEAPGSSLGGDDRLAEWGRKDELRRLRRMESRWTKMNDACGGDPTRMVKGDRGLRPRNWR